MLWEGAIVFFILMFEVFAKPQIKHIRSFSEDNISKFKSELDLIDFSPILQIDCSNEAYSKYMNLYKQPFDIAFPLITIQVGSRNINHGWLRAY